MKKINLKDNGIYVIIGAVVFIVAILFAILVTNLVSNETRKLVDDFDGDYNAQIGKIIKLYNNNSCDGSIYFKNVTEYDKKYSTSELDNDTLTRYVIAYLESIKKVKDAKESTIQSMAKNLFVDSKKLKINDIEYRKRIYSLKKGKLTRKNTKCDNNTIKYLTSIVGYTNDEKHIYIDMNIGYVREGYLYSLEDIKLNKYDETKPLQSLFTVNSYYVLTYTLKDKIFKLDTVELKQKY